MNRSRAASILAALLIALAGCASAAPSPWGGTAGAADAASCRQHDLLIQIYRPGSRMPGW